MREIEAARVVGGNRVAPLAERVRARRERSGGAWRVDGAEGRRRGFEERAAKRERIMK